MIIEKIVLKNFRNYDHVEICPVDGINLFFGENGAGKTNIIEAIHCCCLGKSHRNNQETEMIMDRADQGLCSVILKNGKIKYEITICFQKNKKKKIIKIQNKTISHIYEMIGLLKCVIFSPEDLEIIKGGPTERRKYIDMLISQLDTRYFIALQKYRYILEQRNILLKNIKGSKNVDHAYFEAIDDQLIQYMMMICKKRKSTINKLNYESCSVYQYICVHEDEQLTIEYQTNVDENDFEKNKNRLNEYFEDDLKYGITNFGIHRDEIFIKLNGKNMKQFASQGQIRTASLSMKFAQLKIIEEETKEVPVLLLDDVMSELDSVHRNRLIKYIQNVQTFITCTDDYQFENEKHKLFKVCKVNKNGTIIEKPN